MVNKSWFIYKVLEVTRNKLKEALKDMPDEDFERDYWERWRFYKKDKNG